MASWIEMFQMPYAEVAKKFRKSELFLIGWRSQETALDMQEKIKAPQRLMTQAGESVRRRSAPNGTTPDWLPPECYNEDGEPEVRKMDSKTALRFLRWAGFGFPVMPFEMTPPAEA